MKYIRSKIEIIYAAFAITLNGLKINKNQPLPHLILSLNIFFLMIKVWRENETKLFDATQPFLEMKNGAKNLVEMSKSVVTTVEGFELDKLKTFC